MNTTNLSKRNHDEKENNKILSLDNMSTIHKGLLLFLLIISGNYIGSLVSCRTQDLFNNNIYVKHMIGFISLYFFIILAELSINPFKALILSIPMYFYFIVLTKSESTFFISVIFFLLILVFLHNYKSYLDKKENLSKNEILYLKNNNILRKIVIGIIFTVTLIGFLIYLGMKKVEYKNNFNFKNFFFGNIVCKNNFLGKKTSLNPDDINLAKKYLNLELIIYFIKKAFS